MAKEIFDWERFKKGQLVVKCLTRKSADDFIISADNNKVNWVGNQVITGYWNSKKECVYFYHNNNYMTYNYECPKYARICLWTSKLNKQERKNDINRESKLIQIANYYGKEPQLRQTQEELAELILAISKCVRNDLHFQENFVEEIADVEIMLEQLKLFMTDSELNHLEFIKEAKIVRQLERIEREKARKISQYEIEKFWEEK